MVFPILLYIPKYDLFLVDEQVLCVFFFLKKNYKILLMEEYERVLFFSMVSKKKLLSVCFLF